MATLLAALVAAAAVAPPAGAHEPTYRPSYDRCIDAAGGVTAAMIDCMHAELDAQDARLNAGYRAASRALPAARRAALTRAQRAWVAWRDARCAFELDPDGGSIARIVANSCVLQLTTERATELEGIARDAAGP
ncbi:lysozyme inhibitor LprI family protein [Lysobacter humi (ex Lee et al. 2017)]